ncbi:hypothetical protein ACTMU2_34205 [Cupriavidus basilensis]
MAEVNAIPELIALAAAGVGCTVLSYASVCAELRKGLAIRLSHCGACHVAAGLPVVARPTMPLSVAASCACMTC